MDYLQSFAISSAGMTAERTRVEVAALNMANANSAATADSVFRPLRVVAQAGLAAHGATAARFDTLVDSGLSGPSVRIEASNVPPRRVLDASHPLADAQGYINYPAVDTAAEMVTMMSATRAYEANVAAMNSARAIALKSLEIGGGS